MNPIKHIRTCVFQVTQVEFAGIAGTAQGVVSRWEREELVPDQAEMARIRAEAVSRGHAWDDRWFFEAPSEAAA